MNPKLKHILMSALYSCIAAVAVIVLDPATDWGDTAAWLQSMIRTFITALTTALGIGVTKKINSIAAPFVLAALLTLVGVKATAGNLAPEFSHGPSLPVFTVKFDDTDDAIAGMMNAGAGYSLRWNMLPNDEGSIRMLTVAAPILMQHDGTDFALRVGGTIGTINDILSIGAAVDLVDTGDDTGLLLGDVTKQNVMILVGFGINLGGGVPQQSKSRSLFKQPDPAPPPGFVKLW